MKFVNHSNTRVAFDNKGHAVLSLVFTADAVPPSRKQFDESVQAALAPLITDEAVEHHPAVVRAKEQLAKAEACCREIDRNLVAMRLQRQRFDLDAAEARNRDVSPADAPALALELVRWEKEKEALLQREAEMEEGAQALRRRLSDAEREVPYRRTQVVQDLREQQRITLESRLEKLYQQALGAVAPLFEEIVSTAEQLRASQRVRTPRKSSATIEQCFHGLTVRETDLHENPVPPRPLGYWGPWPLPDPTW